MRMIITSTGNSLQATFDMRFGRCGWFCLWDTSQNKIEFIENQHKNLNGGAGTKAAETVAELKAAKIVSGDFGPKAKALLAQLNIQMIVYGFPEKTIEEVLDLIHH